MPRGDRTGPRGSGPMTGRGMDCYAGYPGLDYMYPGPGFGYGWGRGFGTEAGGTSVPLHFGDIHCHQ